MSEDTSAPAPEAAEPAESEGLDAQAAVASATEPVEEAIAQKQQEDAKKALIKKYKLKIDGKEEDFELNLDDEEEVKKHLQMSKAASKRMQELAELKKDISQLVQKLKDDPAYILERAGIDVDDFSEKRLARKLEDMQKSPEQKKAEAMEAKLKEYEDRIKQEEEARKQESQLRMQQEEATRIQEDIISAIKNHPELPESPLVLEYIAKYMMFAVENGHRDVTVNDVVPYVKRDLVKNLQGWIGKVPETILEDLIGKDNFERARKHRLKQSRQAPLPTPAANVQSTGQVKEPEKPKQKQKLNDFIRGLGSKA